MGDWEQQVEASLHEATQCQWPHRRQSSTFAMSRIYPQNKVNNNAQHDAFSASESERRPAFDINLRASQQVSLSLPHCFRGLITITHINPSQQVITLSPALEKLMTLLSDVQGTLVYLVGKRPRSWMLWRADGDSKEGDEAAAGVGRDSEEPLDKLLVNSWSSALQIYWDGEPGFPR
jgi:hypothetical protein